MVDGARDTIAAVATARGRAGVGVVRVSGPRARAVASHILGSVPAPRRATLRDFRDPLGEVIDRGIALYFPAPASFTGEDVLELQAHGGPVLLDALLDAAVAAGARRAGPGEFTERAFLDGRLDLAQAEAVADLIAASTRQAARAAQAALRGEFSRRVEVLAAQLLDIRVRLEATLDFAEDGVEEDAAPAVTQALESLLRDIQRIERDAGDGVRLNDGLRAVLVGPPNAGKSSVLNRLAGDERAIVTPVPGTTRDVIRETVWLQGMHIELTDTAGLRTSRDCVEQAGMDRTRREAGIADLLIVVLDDSDPDSCSPVDLPPGVARITLRNKADLSGATIARDGDTLWVSALTGDGFDAFAAQLAEQARALTGEGAFTARQRHLDALARARSEVVDALALHRDARGGELVAESLRLAHAALGEITGQVTSDELLGEIFATFCIGK